MSLASAITSRLYGLLARWLDSRGMRPMALAAWRQAASGGREGAAFEVGRRLVESGRGGEALPYLKQALSEQPERLACYTSLGAAHRLRGEWAQAKAVWLAGLARNPRSAPILCNLGELSLVRGDATKAADYLQEAYAADPDLLEIHANRAAVLFELARFDEARDAAEEAVRRFPDVAGLQVNYGNVLLHTGKARLAVKAFREALVLDPGCAEAHMNLALLFGESHHLAETLEFIQREISLKGETVQRLGALALAQMAKKDFVSAEATCRKILDIQPAHISALGTLAGCLSHRGDHLGAIEFHQKALEVSPMMPGVASNVAFESTYLPAVTPEAIFAYHQQWATQFEVPLQVRRYVHTPVLVAPERLKIGYVSGDLGYHPVGFLLRDVMAHHDRARFEIHCFSMVRQEDDITAAIRAKTEHWHDILLESDDDVARLIHEQGIHVLVDLSGHTAYNRLPAFALKPAPIAASWIGYFHSTGLESIDYFITDPHTSPRSCGQCFSEIPVYLPHSRFCYSPPDYAAPVAPTPALANGYITFGCFNRPDKLGPEVIETWARILEAVPSSRLLLKALAMVDEKVVARLQESFAAQGIGADRLEFRGGSSHMEMMAEYGDVDIALDPFPFNGGMTTLEALWMGVPVVTLEGQGIVSRQTWAVLANLGLTEVLAFPDRAAYIAGAVALAQEAGFASLSGLRARIRPLMAESPVCRPDAFARDLEALYLRMWQAWGSGTKLLPYTG